LITLARKEGMPRIISSFIILYKSPKPTLETFYISFSPKNNRITKKMGCIDFENKEMGRVFELVGNHAFGAKISWRKTYFSQIESPL